LVEKQSQQVIENTRERPKIGQNNANLGRFSGYANGAFQTTETAEGQSLKRNDLGVVNK
jgi:hypothetical protein